jgi:hypothetical protein
MVVTIANDAIFAMKNQATRSFFRARFMAQRDGDARGI